MLNAKAQRQLELSALAKERRRATELPDSDRNRLNAGRDNSTWHIRRTLAKRVTRVAVGQLERRCEFSI